MISNIIFWVKFIVSFLPFVLFAFFNSKANFKKEDRHRQYMMPVIAVVYSIILFIFLDKLAQLCYDAFWFVAGLFDKIKLSVVSQFIRSFYMNWGIFLLLILFNTFAIILYVIIKSLVKLFFRKKEVEPNSWVSKAVKLVYTYDMQENKWYIKEHYGQACMFVKTVYYASVFASAVAMFISCLLCKEELISAPFYPVFAIIIIGEFAFYIDGVTKEEEEAEFQLQADQSTHVAMYPLLRKPLKALFGDKLSQEGTTVNNGSVNSSAIEDILVNLEGSHVGDNYATFIRKKAEAGLKPDVDYVRCGYDLAMGKSLLFNTPFYDKLTPYAFYAMNRMLLTGGKVLIVLGRHGTENDLKEWCQKGMKEVSNIPDLWEISILTDKPDDDHVPDIGIITRSGVHDLGIHKANLSFLKEVSFVFIVEPSRLVATAQIGLNLLIRCCGEDKKITYCSVDRNCDGLVDALSHILMTNITEVAATEYPHGTSSYMYWTADGDYLQHRILPGVSRYLGMGTELSLVALKNQVQRAVWYGGETFPVHDIHWIAKQYYYDLLTYAQLPANQETFNNCFQTSFNMCNEQVRDYSFITVEDDRNNLFETRRNFATIAEEQGFVNVISSEYMLREYMACNSQIFTADAKAIPYLTADYARTTRNSILSLSLLLCVDAVQEDMLKRQMVVIGLDENEPVKAIWKELRKIFGNKMDVDGEEESYLTAIGKDGKEIRFQREKTIVYKRSYSIKSGKFESVYTIDNPTFASIILDDLQNASYVAEQESKDTYIGTELKGHVYQKYMPGQFFTLNGKYYEMITTLVNNQILVRRASEHITGRLTYRQVRNYKIEHMQDAQAMGMLKTVNNIHLHYQYAKVSVSTPGYWKLGAYNDFENGILVKINGVPERKYCHKQILKLDFSEWGDIFTDSVRMTLTNLINEAFVTLFADNQPFISAVTKGNYDAPLTYSLEVEDETADKCIYIVEDSQLDLGLLIAVERNLNRIFHIISDYLSWNQKKIEDSIREQNEKAEQKEEPEFQVFEEEGKKKGFFAKIGDFFKNLFKKKPKPEFKEEEFAQDYMMIYGKPYKMVKGKWVACSQEEFDKRMNKRHELIDEQNEARKAWKDEVKKAEKEEREQEKEQKKESTGVEITVSEEEESPEDDNASVLTKEDKKRLKEEQKAAKKEAKLLKKQAKAAAKEEKRQAKAAAKAAKKQQKAEELAQEEVEEPQGESEAENPSEIQSENEVSVDESR